MDIKTFTNALLSRVKGFRGNWNQNDPTADDYIKNRPFYTGDIEEVEIIPLTTIDMSSSVNTLKGAASYWGTNLEISNPTLFEAGKSYTVIWDGIEYVCKAHYDNYGFVCVGDETIESDGNTSPSIPFYICMYDFTVDSQNVLNVSNPDSGAYICALDDGVHTLKITGQSRKVVKIPSEYLPEIKSDCVSYGEYQNLTSDQMATARENMQVPSLTDITGMLKYTSQTLSTSQKTQARKNIGAMADTDMGVYVTDEELATALGEYAKHDDLATVASSGSYSDLEDVPLSKAVVQKAGEVITWNGDTTDRPFVTCGIYNYYLVKEGDYSKYIDCSTSIWYCKHVYTSTAHNVVNETASSMHLEGDVYCSPGSIAIVTGSSSDTNGIYFHRKTNSSNDYYYIREVTLPFVGCSGAVVFDDALVPSSDESSDKMFRVSVDDTGTITTTSVDGTVVSEAATKAYVDEAINTALGVIENGSY